MGGWGEAVLWVKERASEEAGREPAQGFALEESGQGAWASWGN